MRSAVSRRIEAIVGSSVNLPSMSDLVRGEIVGHGQRRAVHGDGLEAPADGQQTGHRQRLTRYVK
jgi:hypothetical protein